MDTSHSTFKKRLDKQYQWPALYTFKFIVPRDKTDGIKTLFKTHEIAEKPSRNGNYISLTINFMAASSDQVIDYYVKVHELGEGIIA